jgi:transposase InsO family protein
MVGWECVHIAIDDCTRLAYAEVLDDEKATTVVAFLRRAVVFFERHGMQQLLTDNGGGYGSMIHAIACRALSQERAAALNGWLWYYNHQRKHSALGHKPPIARLNERTNLLGTYI